jgi:hypothetical protein
VHTATTSENPPLMTENTHPSRDTELNAHPDIGVSSLRYGKVRTKGSCNTT